jgi:hypothetical protein
LRSATAWRVGQNVLCGYDGAPVSPDFANGAITGAFAYAASSLGQGGGQSSDDGDPTVELRYRQLGSIDGYDYSHTYIVVTGPNGEQWYMGAFATGDPTDPSATLAADQISSGGGFGKLHAVWDDFNASVAGNDFLVKPLATQVVLRTTTMSMSDIENDLIGFAKAVNVANLDYHALSTNSNAFANQAVSNLGIARPTPPVWAPGHSVVLIGGH